MVNVGMPRTVLAGDIGGTHTRLALYACDPMPAGPPEPLSRVDLESMTLAKEQTLEEVVASFLVQAGHGVPAAIVLACAGPVRGGEGRITNVPWVVSEAGLRSHTGAARVHLVNDFEAMAHGTETLEESDLAVLQSGERSATGARLVLGAGTGLGTAFLVPGEAQQPARVFASEGSHQSFAPRDTFEDGLLVWLRTLHGRVSVERVVSGLGLVDLYRYIVDTGVASTTDGVHRAVAKQGAVAIGVHGQGQSGDPACVLAVERFVSLYGAYAGDAALGMLPFGGVVITGGMTAGLLPVIRERFMPAFLGKGRLRSVLEPLHVAVALPADTGMRGASRLALGAAGISVGK